jgi:PAT family beta-lactamase induction signal transducer AmpG
VTLLNPLWHRLACLLVLGFASGLPLALTGQAMQAWLTQADIDLATIGFLSLVALPYTFKFLWAPLMDRFEPPLLGRRRGWIVLTQLLLAAVLWGVSRINPSQSLMLFALMITALAFLSASQDVVIDAYRTDLLRHEERGLGSSMAVLGYRLGMIVSGGIAFIWADAASGWNWNWADVYRLMAILMLSLAAFSALGLPALPKTEPSTSDPRRDLVGFAMILLTVGGGYLMTDRLIEPALSAWGLTQAPDGSLKRWMQLAALLSGLALTLPVALQVTRRIGFETLNRALDQFFSRRQAGLMLLLIVLYKLGDAFAGSITTPFLIKAALYTQAEVGVVNKVIGIWMTILGAILGGALMMRLRLYRSLLLFGVLQMASNLGFFAIAVLGRDSLGGFTLPAFNWFIVSLTAQSQVDWLLLLVVAGENITGGMGTAAAVALIMALCNKTFSATQYALLSALATIGRVWVGPMAGVLAPSIGWPLFFVLSTALALPGLLLLMTLRQRIDEADKGDAGTQ